MKIKLCLHCGKEIPPDAGGRQAHRKMYCDLLCKDAAQKARKRALLSGKALPRSSKTCDICGKEFEAQVDGDFHHLRYCSDACREEAHRRRDRARKQRLAAIEKQKTQIGEYALACDPWATGQLPAEVRANALWA